jgi:hypothetical protein
MEFSSDTQREILFSGQDFLRFAQDKLIKVLLWTRKPSIFKGAFLAAFEILAPRVGLEPTT